MTCENYKDIVEAIQAFLMGTGFLFYFVCFVCGWVRIIDRFKGRE